MVFRKKTYFIVVAVVLIFGQCKSSKTETTNIDSIIQHSIQHVDHITYNNSRTYLLAVEAADQNELIKFVVIEIETQKIILEKKIRPGYVKWFNDNQLELLDIPGMIEKNKTTADYIQILTLPSTSKE